MENSIMIKRKKIKVTIPEDMPLVSMDEMESMAKAVFNGGAMPDLDPLTEEELKKVNIEFDEDDKGDGEKE